MTGIEKNQSNVARDYGLSETAYSFGYDLRLKYASYKQDTLNWISSHFAELPSVETPNILSLGCGSGTFDIALMNIFQQYKKEWHFTGLDFSKTDLDHFHENLSALDRETRSRVKLTYKKFDQSTDLGECYDLITMVHFLHSFDDVLPIIKNAHKQLLPGGKLLIIQSGKQGISEIKDKFMDILPNQKFQCSDEIKALLQAENILFTSHKIDSYFDVSIMRTMSLDTLLLMSFCFTNDLSVLNTWQQDQIRKAFLVYAKGQTDGTDVIYEPMEVIMCHA